MPAAVGDRGYKTAAPETLRWSQRNQWIIPLPSGFRGSRANRPI